MSPDSALGGLPPNIEKHYAEKMEALKKEKAVGQAMQAEGKGTFDTTIANDSQAMRYHELRMAFTDMETLLRITCSRGRELSLALTKLEEAAMWANKAISREPQP